MALYRKPDSKYWWVDVTVAGKRFRGSSKKTVKTHAQQFEAAQIHKLSTGQISEIRLKAPTLREFAPRFESFLQDSRLDPDTKDYYRNGWRMLSTQKVATMRLDQITASTGNCIAIDGSGSRVNCALRTMRRMLSLAEEFRVILSAPSISLVEENKRDRLISPAEEDTIITRSNGSVRDVFVMMMDAGVRPNEAVALDWDNVDFVRRSFLVTRGKTKNARRRLTMTARVYDLLVARAGNGSRWVFPSSRRPGQHIAARSIVVMFQTLKREIGLPADLVLYSARHTFATDFQEAFGDLTKTSKQLGHGATRTTERYVHPKTAETASVMDARNAQRHVSRHAALSVN